MPIDSLLALMEKFVSGEAMTLQDAEKLEGALLDWAPQYPKLEELADDLAQYRPGGGDSLHNYAEMKPVVAHHLERLRAGLAE